MLSYQNLVLIIIVTQVNYKYHISFLFLFLGVGVYMEFVWRTFLDQIFALATPAGGVWIVKDVNRTGLAPIKKLMRATFQMNACVILQSITLYATMMPYSMLKQWGKYTWTRIVSKKQLCLFTFNHLIICICNMHVLELRLCKINDSTFQIT